MAVRLFTLSSALVLASVAWVDSFGITSTQMTMNIPTVTLGKLKKAGISRGRSSLGFMNELFIFRVYKALEGKKDFYQPKGISHQGRGYVN